MLERVRSEISSRLPSYVLSLVRATLILGVSSYGILMDRASSAMAAQCQYINGFASAVSHNPQIPGCLDNEHFNSISGKMEQNTLGNGRLEWDSKTNIITFTINGKTEAIGSDGLLHQPNSQPATLTNTDSPKCKIEGSFRHLAIARPDIIGRCLENAHPDTNNSQNIIQQTTKGTLWLISGMTYFNNGNRTYLLGDRTIYERADDASCPGERGSQTTTPCQETPLIINHIYTQENTVGLTLDDGWSREAIRAMGYAIISTGNRATFFINGRYYREDSDLILELDKTGQIFWANHGDNHRDLWALARDGKWDLVQQEIENGDPCRNIPQLQHCTKDFRFPGFSDGSPKNANSDLRRMIVFQYGLTIFDSDQGNSDHTDLAQPLVDERIFTASIGQIIYGHFLPRNIPTFRQTLLRLNQRGIRGDDLDHMLNTSLVRTISQN